MAIEQNLADILAARYGRDVRQSIHDGIAECYSDVSEAKTRADESILNVDAKVALADAAALNANQKADLANTAAQTANTAATNADQKADLANTAAQNADSKAALANAATEAANTATGTANTAATNADQKAAMANAAIEAANTATNNANVATTNVQAAIETANTAATNADQKASLANTAATNADQKAELANTAAGSANTAASSANTAAQTANAAADNAEAKATLANNAAQYASGFTQPYIHIKYSAVQPTSNADMVDVPSDWIGLYSGNSATAPVNYTDYRWFRYKGEPGDVGNHNHDTLYLGIAAKAADSDKLDGLDSTEFARSSHDHNALYLGVDAKAVDSDKLDGKDSTEFSDKVHTHTKSEITDFPTEMPPEAHNHPVSDLTDFPTEMPPEAHAHGNITNDGKIGTSADNFLVTGADGIVEAKDIPSVVGLIGVSNPNILHNWDFRNPVNQRGVSYITASVYQYVIDRWAIAAETTVTVNAASMSVSAGGTIQQIIEGGLLAGKQVTASIEEANGTIRAVTGAFPLASGDTNLSIPGFGVVRLSIYAGNAVFALVPSNAFAIARVKLELGPCSTLAYDPPMDHAVELPKCQRYLRYYTSGTFAIANAYNANDAQVVLYGIPMRVAPTVTYANLVLWDGTAKPVSGLSAASLTIGGGVAISVYATGLLTAGRGYRLQHAYTSDFLMLSAEL